MLRFLKHRRKLAGEQRGRDHSREACDLTEQEIARAETSARGLGLPTRGGAITRAQLIELLHLLGVDTVESALDLELFDLGIQSDLEFSFEEFLHIYKAFLKQAQWKDEVFKAAFRCFDINGDGNLDMSELSTICNEIGDLTREECETFVSIVDANGNGVIELDEFLQLQEQSKQALDKYAEKVMKESMKLKEEGGHFCEEEEGAHSPNS
jgi:Ca2+-binding EF-hand superfamily protein